MWPFLETTEGPIHLRAAQNVTEWAAPRNDFPSTNTLFVIFASFVGVAYSASFVASAASWLLALLLQGVSSLLLGVMVIMAYLDSAGHVFFDDMDSDKPVESQDREFLVSSEVRDFAEHAGLQYEEHHVETKDGYILVLQRVYEATAKTSKSFIPVICQHGVLQRGGVYIASQENSFAITLARNGFDVWIGNSRCVFPMHKNLSTRDSAYWNWSLDELGLYDVPAIISHVKQQTHQKVVYVGHSQGVGEGIAALDNYPALSDDISLFVGLAPAVFVHPPPRWAVKYALCRMTTPWIKRLFGSGNFIPIMFEVQNRIPAAVFAHLGYTLFNYLFGWTDRLWEQWRRPAYFQFTPAPVSSKLIGGWMKSMRNGRICRQNPTPGQDPNYGFSNIRCPVALFHGKEDNIVNGDRLAEELRKQGSLIHYVSIPEYTHMDVIWSRDASKNVFAPIMSLIHSTEASS